MKRKVTLNIKVNNMAQHLPHSSSALETVSLGGAQNLSSFNQATSCLNTTQIGRYTLGRRVAAGGQGEVFFGTQRQRKSAPLSVAVKVADSVEQTQRHSLLREARIVRELKHPNIVKWQGSGRVGPKDYFAMEWVGGSTVQRALRTNGRFELGTALDLAQQLCHALHRCHTRTVNGQLSPVIHCDVKPSNLLLLQNGQLKLADFGIALETKTDVPRFDITIGSPAYMCPEQAKPRPLSPTVDVFSVGVVLFEMATGQRMFKKDTIRKMISDRVHVEAYLEQRNTLSALNHICPPLIPIIRRCVNEQPSDRYPSVQGLGLRLRTLQQRVSNQATQHSAA